MAAVDEWFEPRDARLDSSLRLFLFPHAGGTAALYRSWERLLPVDVSFQVVVLPGRDRRIGERPFVEIEPLLDAVFDNVVTELDGRPYALFGHSLGAQLAYRLAVRLEGAGEVPPALVGVSSWSPEGFAPGAGGLSRGPESELVEWLRGLGQLPPGVQADPALMAMVLAVVRADLALFDSYEDDGARLRAPLASYCGRDDPLLQPDAMVAWRTRTDRYLGNLSFPGDHFYIEAADHAVAVTADVARHLRRRPIKERA
jgi:surfactin synthase thioesterase subunit